MMLASFISGRNICKQLNESYLFHSHCAYLYYNRTAIHKKYTYNFEFMKNQFETRWAF